MADCWKVAMWLRQELEKEDCLIELPYNVVKAAYELLKEKEPRVLTLKEVESSEDSVWLDKELPGWEPIPVFVEKVGMYLDTFIDHNGLRFQGEKSNGGEYGDYDKTWRCWSARPADEQKEAVPWEK